LYKGHQVSFRGIKRPGRGVDHPFPSKERLKKEYTHTSIPTCAFMAYSRVRAVICGLSGCITFFHITS